MGGGGGVALKALPHSNLQFVVQKRRCEEGRNP